LDQAVRVSARATPKARSKPRASPPPEPAPPTETQRRLLDAAVALFAERGFDGVTTAEIASRARVAEKTLFANFGNKERLYQAALQPATVWASMVPEAIRTLAPVLADPPAEPRALLHALLENRVQFARAHRREIKMLVQHLLTRPEAVRSMTEAWSERLAPLLMPVLDRMIAAGRVRDDVPPLALVRIVVTSAVGYVLTAVVLRPDLAWDDAREIELIVNVLADGLVPRAPRKKRK
jgi:AcrR family transcriptional regulator